MELGESERLLLRHLDGRPNGTLWICGAAPGSMFASHPGDLGMIIKNLET